MRLRDHSVFSDTFLSASFSIVMLCVLRETVIVQFTLPMILGFVLMWHLLLVLIDNLRPPPLVIGTVLVALALVMLFLALRSGKEASGRWLDGYLNWAMAGSGHNEPAFLLYRILTVAAISMVFSLAVFLLLRCGAHVGLLLVVGSSVFLGMQWIGFAYPGILLWLFLLLILLMALRQGQWRSGQQGLVLMMITPLCVLLLLCVSWLPLDGGPMGTALVNRIGSVLGQIESPFNFGLFTFTNYQGESSDINRDLGGPFEPTDRLMLTLDADKPLYVKARSAREYDGRRWLTEDLEGVPFEDPIFRHTDRFYDRKVLKRLSQAEQEALTPTFERYLLPFAVNVYSFEFRRATIYYEDIVTNSVFTPENFLTFGLRDAEEEQRVPFLIDRSQMVRSETAMRQGDSYLTYYCEYVHPTSDRDEVLNFSSPTTTVFQDVLLGDDYLNMLSRITNQVHERYMELPASLPERVYDLSRAIVRNQVTAHQKAQAIEKYLATTFPYETNVPATPEDRDFVDYFLFDLQKGYCTYYATAMVVLCRAAGVPARYVEGFKFSPEKRGGRYIATGEQAHAWVEVYLDGFGWIAYEPTAGFGGDYGDDDNPSPTPAPTPRPSTTPKPSEPEPSERTVSPTPVVPTPPPSAGERIGSFLKSAGLFLLRWSWLLLLTAWVMFNVLRHTRYRKGLQTARYGKQSLRRLYKRSRRMLALLGYKPEKTETPLEFAARCGAALQDEGRLSAFTDGYYRAVYGDLRPGPEQRRATANALIWLEGVVRSGKRNAVRLWMLRYGLGWV